MQVGTKEIKQTDATVGESRTADKIISDAGFAVDKNGESTEELGEMVIIQSKTLNAKEPGLPRRGRRRRSSAALGSRRSRTSAHLWPPATRTWSRRTATPR